MYNRDNRCNGCPRSTNRYKRMAGGAYFSRFAYLLGSYLDGRMFLFGGGSDVVLVLS